MCAAPSPPSSCSLEPLTFANGSTFSCCAHNTYETDFSWLIIMASFFIPYFGIMIWRRKRGNEEGGEQQVRDMGGEKNPMAGKFKVGLCRPFVRARRSEATGVLVCRCRAPWLCFAM